LDGVQSKSSAWVPDAAIVATNKKAGTGFASFETLYEHYYAGNTIDMMEMAMWWTSCEKNGTYGAFGADGLFLPREDLGGAAALRRGVDKVGSCVECSCQ
jgi:hypothetical protein